MNLIIALLASSWLAKAVGPIVAQIFIQLLERFRADAQFRHEVEMAMRGHYAATNKEERRNARKAMQRIISTPRR